MWRETGPRRYDGHNLQATGTPRHRRENMLQRLPTTHLALRDKCVNCATITGTIGDNQPSAQQYKWPILFLFEVLCNDRTRRNA